MYKPSSNISKPLILFITPSISNGGAENVTLHTIKLIKDTDAFSIHLVSLCCFKGVRNINRFLSRENVTNFNFSKTWHSFPRLILLILFKKPSLLVAIDESTLLLAMFIRFFLPLLKLKVLYVCHNTLSLRFSHATAIRRFFLVHTIPMLLNRVSHIVSVSQGVLLDLNVNLGIPTDKITCIYNPVMIPNIPPLTPHFRKILRSAPINMLSCGRLVHQKNHKFGLLLTKNLIALGIDMNYIIVGSGPLHSMIMDLSHNLGISTHVKVVGSVDRGSALSLIKNTNLFLLPSLWEGLPTVLIEAFLLGSTVLSSDCPSGPSELTRLFGSGYLFPCDCLSSATNMAYEILTNKLSLLQSKPCSLPIQLQDEFISSLYHRVIVCILA